MNREGIDITVDLHEASPEYPTINTIVAHQDALSLGSQALINMQLEGMSIGLEPSPENLHGLTHREPGRLHRYPGPADGDLQPLPGAA